MPKVLSKTGDKSSQKEPVAGSSVSDSLDPRLRGISGITVKPAPKPGTSISELLKEANRPLVTLPSFPPPVLDLPQDFLAGKEVSDDEDDEYDYELVCDDDDYDDFVLPMHMPILEQNPAMPAQVVANVNNVLPAQGILAAYNGSLGDPQHPPVRDDVANLTNSIWKGSHKISELYEKVGRPSNLEVFKVDVNEEFMLTMGEDSNKPVRVRDLKLRTSQGAITGAAWAVTNTLNSLTKLENATDSDKIVKEILPDLVDANVSALKFLAHANAQVNNFRRQNLKSLINSKYHGLCKDSTTIPSSFLFGDNLSERLRAMGQAVRVSRNNSRPARRGRMSMGSNRFMSNYGGYRQRPYGMPYAQVKDQFLLPRKIFDVNDLYELQQSEEVNVDDVSYLYRGQDEIQESPQETEEVSSLNKRVDNGQLNVPFSEVNGPSIQFNTVSEFKAGEISKHADEWAKLTSDSIILKHVRGLAIEWDDNDVPEQEVVPKPLYFSQDEHKFLESEIERLLEMGVIESTKHSSGEFISKIFLRPKKQKGKFRLILDLKSLNDDVQYHHFKMDTLETILKLVNKDAYMLSLDLQDAYYSLKIQPSHRKFLRFEYAGQLYQFTCLPNGLSSGPRLFTKILKVPLSFLREMFAMDIAAYIDDIFLTDKQFDQCLKNGQQAADLFQKLGFVISPKSVLTPTQCIEHVGFIIDSINMKVSLPTKKIETILELLDDCLKSEMLSIRLVSKLLGTLEATKPGNRFAQLYTKLLTMAKNEALSESDYEYDDMMILSDEIREDLNWWVQNLRNVYAPIFVGQPDYTIFTDASLSGWGCSFPDEEEKFGGRWNTLEAQMHINVLELLAILYSLRAICSEMSGVHIRIMTDNTTAKLLIQNQGSVRSISCNEITRQIWLWAIERNIWLSSSYIPGVLNEEADDASRNFNDETEWSLSQDKFAEICQILGEPQVDLFASRLNFKVKPFCSWMPDPEATYIDSFSIDWNDVFGYAFPPFALIPAVLQKIQMEGATVLMVVPKWPTKPWFSQFMRMIVSQTVLIPVTHGVLFLPSRPDKVHSMVNRLRLIAAVIRGH